MAKQPAPEIEQDEEEDPEFAMVAAMSKDENASLEVEPELLEKQKQIREKGHTYNIITDTSLKTNEIYRDEQTLAKLFQNANKVVFGAAEANQALSPSTENLKLYTEKVTIWEKGILKDILIVIYNFTMYFIFLEKDIFFMKPINILTDIEFFQKCTMFKENAKSDQKQPDWLFVCFKLKGKVVKQ
jgi:hypothetical protein